MNIALIFSVVLAVIVILAFIIEMIGLEDND